MWRRLPGVESHPVPTSGTRSAKEDPAMRRFALLLGFALLTATTSAVAQNCDGFTDVLASSPFCPDVAWLKTFGVTKGCAPSQFCPNENVTRLQMAAFMHRLGNNPAFVNGGNAFGTTAVLGPTDNQALVLQSGGFNILNLASVGNANYALATNVVGGIGPNNATGVVGATIGGGGCMGGFHCSGVQPNVVKGDFGTIGGGLNNTAWTLATVGGGAGNTASGFASTVAGGNSNMASSAESTVAGGTDNTASGSQSTVAGGYANTAGGLYSIVAGGISNVASADYTFAAGRRAQASTTGSFIWADSQDFDFAPSVDNFFGVRATGGVGLTIAIDPTTGSVTQFCNLLPPIASWSCTSDRDAKENFIPADGKDILQRLVAMPLFSWNFKGADPTIRSLGPTAQDFYEAFGLGRNDKSIANVNLEGVALAAVQGLNAKVNEQSTLLHRQQAEQAATIQEQQREIAELREQLQHTMSLANDVVALKAALAELQRGRETVAVK
jgi:hypothetical protein